LLFTIFEPHGRFTTSHADLLARKNAAPKGSPNAAFKAGLERFRDWSGIPAILGAHDVDAVLYGSDLYPGHAATCWLNALAMFPRTSEFAQKASSLPTTAIMRRLRMACAIAGVQVVPGRLM